MEEKDDDDDNHHHQAFSAFGRFITTLRGFKLLVPYILIKLFVYKNN
jgi:hypothetical protein